MADNMHRKFAGQITVFLALCSGLIVTVILAEIETARYMSIAMMQRNAAMIACESMLAQYNIPLYEMYSIFGVDGNGRDLTETMEKQVRVNSGTGIFKAQVNGVCVTDLCSLVDENYSPLIKEIVQYMKNAGCINLVGDLVNSFSDGKLDGLQSGKNEMKNQITQSETLSLQQKAEYDQSLPSQGDHKTVTDDKPVAVQTEDPRKSLTEILKKGLLSIVLPADFSVSDAKLDSKGVYEGYVSKNVDFTSAQSVRNKISQNLFNVPNIIQTKSQDVLIYLYANQKFKNALDTHNIEHDTVLKYEMEYMLCGHQSDSTNLLDIINRLAMMRTVLNFTYLLTDASKTSSAHAMAANIAAAALMPWLEPVVYSLLLVTWAYGEAVMDLKVLMSGGNVALLKNSANWQLSLNGISMLTSKSVNSNTNQQSGLSYEDYLLLLWLMAGQTKKVQRMTGLMEVNVRQNNGNMHFSMKDCYYSIGCIVEFKIRPLFLRFTGVFSRPTHVYQWSECY